MRLFIFGLGYTAQHFVRGFGHHFSHCVGTVRSDEKIATLASENIAAVRFGGAEVSELLAQSDGLLVSAPPRLHDPVLADYLEEMAASRLGRIVYLSTIGVYGHQDGGWVDETTPPEPYSPRSSIRVEVERQWLDFAEQHGKTLHILRLAGIYGPGQNALHNLKNGTARRINKPGQVFNRIHVEDIGKAILAAFQVDLPGGLFNIADDEPAPPQDVIVHAAKLLGVEPPPELDFATAPMSEMARSFYSKNQRVSNRRMREILGVDLSYPTYREGIEALFAQGEGR